MEVSDWALLHPFCPRGQSRLFARTRTCCSSDTPSYNWAVTHRAWNALMKALHGNTTPTDASALREGHRVAVWWTEPDDPAKAAWYTAKVMNASKVPTDTACAQAANVPE